MLNYGIFNIVLIRDRVSFPLYSPGLLLIYPKGAGMKYSLCITLRCNLSCGYCYLIKKNSTMPLQTAREIIDFIFKKNPPGEKLHISLSGGEPLLEFDLVKKITGIIENHPFYDREKVEISVVTNGTVLSPETEKYLLDHKMRLCISCDGPSQVHDIFRSFPNGEGSASVIEKTLVHAKEFFPDISVHAVYHPRTLQYLPLVVEYFSSIGIRQIHLSPDLSALWTRKETDLLSHIYLPDSRPVYSLCPSAKTSLHQHH